MNTLLGFIKNIGLVILGIFLIIVVMATGVIGLIAALIGIAWFVGVSSWAVVKSDDSETVEFRPTDEE